MRLFFLFVTIFVFACSEDTVGPVIPDDSEAYSVYSALLYEEFHNYNLTLVVEDSTGMMGIREEYFDYFLENLEGVTPELLQNFVEINSSKIALRRIPDIDHVFESEYTGDPRSRVILTLSRAAFNPEQTKALVMVGEYYAPLSGGGRMFLLEKSSNGWMLISQVMVWIS